MRDDTRAFDAADALVSLALETHLGGRKTRDLTESILKRHRENPEGDAMNFSDAEILAAPRVFPIGDRVWTWVVNAASVVALASLAWMLLPEDDRRAEIPAGHELDAADEDATVELIEVKDAIGIEKLGVGTLGVRAIGPDVGNPEVRLLVERCPNLETLVLDDAAVDDDGLAPLKALTSLRSLGVPQCARLTDRAIETIIDMQKLRELDLSGFVGQTASFGGELDENYIDPYSKFTSEGIARLVDLEDLWRLELFGTQACDLALRSILTGGASRITSLGLGHTEVTDITLEILARQNRLLELDIASARHLRENASLEVVGRIKSLRSLSIGGNGFEHSKYTSAGIADMRGLALRTLRIHSSTLLGRGNGWGMVSRIGSIEELEVRDCKNFGDDDVAIVTRLPRLRKLTLSLTPEITKNALEAIGNSKVTDVDLTACGHLADWRIKALWDDTPRLERLTMPDHTTVLTREAR